MTRKLSHSGWGQVMHVTQKLYQEQGLTLAQVTTHLQSLDYDVDERLMRRKIAEWGLQKRLQEPDVLTAIDLFMPYRHQHQFEHVSFYIRDRLVLGNEIELYLRKRHITDILGWAQAYDRVDCRLCDHVKLGPPLATSAPSDSICNSERSPSDGSDNTAVALELVQEQNDIPPLHESMFNSSSDTRDLMIYQPNDPQQYRLVIYGLNHIQLICDQYATLQPPNVGIEPLVHAETLHGRFGDRMQHGLARLTRRDLNTAFQSFGEACCLLEGFLSDADPVSLALLLVTLCQVSVQGYQDIVELVLRHAIETVNTGLRAPVSLIWMLRTLLTVSDSADCMIRMLRVMGDADSVGSRLKWRSLYVRERLCDGLYYCGDGGSSASMRLKLLSDQEQFYGRNQRNVLYTLTNVADNYLRSGNLDSASRNFTEAYQRAEALVGYGKAKIQFAALEGLAATRYAQARNTTDISIRGQLSSSNGTRQARNSLQQALELTHCAENIAIHWFEPLSRRTTRIQDMRLNFTIELQQL